MRTPLLFALVGLAQLSAFSQNLLLNGSAEQTINGEIADWTPTIGVSWMTSQYTVYPQIDSETAGTQFFYPAYSYASLEDQWVSEIAQTIDISADSIMIDAGNLNYFFDGYTISFDQGPPDQTNIFIDFFDETDTLLSTEHFGPFGQTITWLHLTETLTAPVGARKVRVRLRSVLINGSSLDGLYEDLYFGRSPLLSVADVNSHAITAFPNPTSGVLQIGTGNSSIEQIAVVDVNGRLVSEFGLGTDRINIGNLPTGIYIVNVISKAGVTRFKVVKTP